MEHQTTIIDLRGPDSSSSGDGFGVLADATGHRRRGLRRIGRAVGALFAIWLAALALAGVGLLPGVGVPLASRSGADGAPPPIDHRSPLVATESTRPALTRAASPAARATVPTPAPSRRRSVAPGRNVAPERHRTVPTAPAAAAPVTTPAAATPAPRRPAIPPGHDGIAPGRSGTAPRHTRPAKTPAPTATPIHGKSDSAPGRSAR
jgi:hypothetical protein